MAKRRNFSPDFKAKVALEAIKGQRTLAEIAARHDVHPILATLWKKALLAHAADAFADPRARDKSAADEHLKAHLYQQIGQLKVELDWIKKIWTRPLRSSAHGSSPSIRSSRSRVSANWPGSRARPPTTRPPRPRATRTCA